MKTCLRVVTSLLVCVLAWSCGGSDASTTSTAPSMTTPPAPAPAPMPAPMPTPAPTPSPPPPTTVYSIIDIGTLGGDTVGYGINGHGDIVGTWSPAQSPSSVHALYYQYASGALNDLGNSPYASVALAINDSEQITGYLQAQGVVWQNGGYQMLLGPAYNEGHSINASGAVAGIVVISSPHNHQEAELWTGNLPTVRIPPIETGPSAIFANSEALAINNAGDATGDYAAGDCGEGCSAHQDIFLWKAGVTTDLGVGQGRSINSNDDIVGLSGTNAILIHQGTTTVIAPGVANGINDTGEIVGNTEGHAFLYVSKLDDLNTLIDPTSPLHGFVSLTDAVAINCNGWISANGTDSRDTRKHAFLLIREGASRPQCP